MKYWFFDGSDVVGPFTPQELAARTGFADTSLVCPENFSENEDNWKTASSFPDFHFSAHEGEATESPEPNEDTDSFDEEMDTLLKEHSPLSEPDPKDAQETPSLQIPKKPAKPAPIEDYFNNIQGEDLGNILGIPDPNENSDMNLARALETQFNKTNPPTDKEIQLEDDPFDEFTEQEQAADEPADSSANAVTAPAPEVKKETPAEQPAAQDTPRPAAEDAGKKSEPALKEQPAHPAAKPTEKSTAMPSVAAPATSTENQPISTPPKTERIEPSSVPISAATEEELILTIRQGTVSQEALGPQDEEQTLAADNAAQQENDKAEPQPSVPGPELLPKEDASVFSLPVLGQPEAETALPPVPEEEPNFISDLSADESAPVTEEQPLPELAPEPTPAVEAPQPEAVLQPESALQPETASEDTAAQTPEENTASEPAEEEPQELVTQAPLDPEPEEPKDPKEETVRNILKGQLSVEPTPEIEEPIKNVPVEPQVNQVRPRLSQTPEIEQFLTQTQRAASPRNNKKAKAALSVLIALLAVGAAFFLNQTVAQETSLPAETQTPEITQPAPAAKLPPAPRSSGPVDELLPDVPALPVAPKAEPSLSDKALAAVQNYQLSGTRGTIASYFDRIYQEKINQGYTPSWSAEPLHKSTYIVKYRLTKTRMEPIVYIFQADAARGRLTGGLNNVTLDLVGKI